MPTIHQEPHDPSHQNLRRYMALGGTTVPHESYVRGMNVPEARKLQSKIRESIKGIFDRADREKRQTSEEEYAICEEGSAMIEVCNRAIKLQTDAEGSFRGRTSTGGWIDTETGKAVTVLNAAQKLQDHVEIDGARPSFTFGDIIRGMALGPSKCGPDVRNALTIGTDSQGGYTVPSILLPELIDNMRASQNVVKAGARTVMLETGKATTIARLDSDPVAAWRTENSSFAISDPVFSAVSLVPKMLGVIVQFSFELLEDSLNLNDAMMRAFAGSFAVEMDRVAMFGSGTSPQPLGLAGTSGINTTSLGVNGAALTSYDPILDAYLTTMNQNAALPTAAIMAPRSAIEFAKLKDVQNQPLRKPDAIQDLPMYSTTSVPINQTKGTSTTASTILVGDWTQLLIGIRTEMRIQLLRELYAATGQYAFLVYLRADIAVGHPKSFCAITGVL